MSESDNEIKTDAQLARELRISRQLLHHHRKFGDAPQGRDVDAWQEYLATVGRPETSAGGRLPELTKQRTRNILLHCERLQFLIDRQRRELLPAEMADRLFKQLIRSAKTRHLGAIDRIVEISRSTLDLPEATDLVRKEIAGIWRGLAAGEWHTTPTSNQGIK